MELKDKENLAPYIIGTVFYNPYFSGKGSLFFEYYNCYVV